MNKTELSITFPHDRATFYFVSRQQMDYFITHHVKYDKEGVPCLINHGIAYKSYYTTLIK
ncbi:MAG: hypothetical protein IJ069_09100 [Prevotella sp.]|nr:hypothetical protein [Prevotella sp.]